MIKVSICQTSSGQYLRAYVLICMHAVYIVCSCNPLPTSAAPLLQEKSQSGRLRFLKRWRRSSYFLVCTINKIRGRICLFRFKGSLCSPPPSPPQKSSFFMYIKSLEVVPIYPQSVTLDFLPGTEFRFMFAADIFELLCLFWGGFLGVLDEGVPLLGELHSADKGIDWIKRQCGLFATPSCID